MKQNYKCIGISIIKCMYEFTFMRDKSDYRDVKLILTCLSVCFEYIKIMSQGAETTNITFEVNTRSQPSHCRSK